MAILDQYGKAFPLEAKPSAPRIQARYDNATTTDANARNWWAADYLSAKAANSYAVRRTLRIRCRYEVSNNPHLWGVCTNNADDLIDSGPTLQCLGSKDFNRRIENAWNEWAKEVELADKLRTCKLAKTIDGEGFLILKTVNDLENPVKLYPVDIEADQVTTPAPQTLAEWWVDGIDLHPVTGKPKSYHVLKYHPGDYWLPGLNPLQAEIIPARNVIHWFPKFRPGQVRGIPIFTPSLDLFTELRSFRKSVLEAAQTAANHSAVIETDAPAGMDDDDGNEEDYRFQRVAINRNMMTVLPARWKMSQFAAQNPNAQYEAFMEKGLSEAIRPLSYPLNLALGTSQKFNFSSAKLDHINYRASLRNERENECERVILEPIFRAFIEEAKLTPGLLPPGVRSAADIPHAWHWPGFESIDPMTDAQADQLRLSGGQDTWQDFWARRGSDWRDVMARQSEAQKEIERLKLVFGEPLKQTKTDTNADNENRNAKNPNKADASKKNRIAALDAAEEERDKNESID